MKKILFTLYCSCLVFCTSAEELIMMDILHCLNKATHIIKAKVISEEGLLAIQEQLKGTYGGSTLQLEELAQVASYKGYAPPNIDAWELVVFLRADSLGSLEPIRYIEGKLPRSFRLALSILWLKEGYVYGGIQPENPGDMKFLRLTKWEYTQRFVLSHIEVLNQLDRIDEQRSCRKKKKALAKLYDSAEYKKLVLNKIEELACPRQAKRLLRKKMKQLDYSVAYRDLQETYLKIASPKEVNRYFKKEFKFWVAYLSQEPEEEWWDFKTKKGLRFNCFKNLIYTLAERKVGHWEQHCRDVVALFSQQVNYQAAGNIGKVDQQLVRYFLPKAAPKK